MHTLTKKMNFDKPPKKVVDYYTKPIHAAAASQNTPIEIKRYQGRVPTDFPAGSYIRNGPNPIDAPPDLWYHMFDVSFFFVSHIFCVSQCLIVQIFFNQGDGMVHNVKFNNNGKVTYCNHQIETERFKERKRVGFDPYMTIGETM